MARTCGQDQTGLDFEMVASGGAAQALKAFRHTAVYDAAIATRLAGCVEGEQTQGGHAQGLPLPSVPNLAAERVQVVTRRQPTEAERRRLAYARMADKHVKSNAILFIQGTATVSVGAGQMNRVDSVYLAARRAGDRSRGAVIGSDAFFPFPDGIEVDAAAWETACIQPGGSLRDKDAIAAADRLDMAMIFTGERYFWH